MMLVGYHSDSAYNFGNGRWCLSWPVARYSQRAANIQGIPGLSSIGRFDASGEFQNLSGTGTSTGGFGFDVPYELPVGAGNTAILPGDQLSFQLWYRDDANSPATGFNLSDMLTATFF